MIPTPSPRPSKPPLRPSRARTAAPLLLVLAGMLVLAGLALVGCGSEAPSSALGSDAVPGEDGAVVHQGEIVQGEIVQGEIRPVILLSGTIQAAEGAILSTPNVRIFPMQVRWVAEDGSTVRAGDRVVEFDNSQLTGRLQDLRTRWQTAISEQSSNGLRDSDAVEQAKIELERKRVEHAKAALDADVPEGLISSQEMAQRRLVEEKARLELAVAQREVAAKLEVAKKNAAVDRLKVQDARRELAEVQRGIERLALRAPKDGIVQIGMDMSSGRTLQVGSNIWPGMEAARIPDLSTLRVEASLFDVDEGRLEVGQAAEVVLDAFPEERLEGRVTSIGRIAETPSQASTRRRFQVLVDVPELDASRMRPGMSVRLRIEAEPVVGPVVPRSSLVLDPRGLGEIGTGLTLADGRVVPVELGLCDTWSCLLVEGPAPGTPLGTAVGSGVEINTGSNAGTDAEGEEG